MISIRSEEDFGKTADGSYAHYIEGTCLSTDTKPTTWANGSKLLEMDTSTLYIWDAENRIWRPW